MTVTVAPSRPHFARLLTQSLGGVEGLASVGLCSKRHVHEIAFQRDCKCSQHNTVVEKRNGRRRSYRANAAAARSSRRRSVAMYADVRCENEGIPSAPIHGAASL